MTATQQSESASCELHALVPPARAPRRRRWSRILLAIVELAILGSAAGYAAIEIRDRAFSRNFGVVLPGELYRSGQISRHRIEQVILDNKLGAIIDLNGFEPFFVDQQVEIGWAKYHAVQHYRFQLRGNGTGKIERFADAIKTIEEKRREKIPVLVHCAGGSQRTGACIAFYRLLVRRDPVEQVYAELLEYGWNPARDTELLEYANANMATLARLLADRGVIAEVPSPIPQLHP